MPAPISHSAFPIPHFPTLFPPGHLTLIIGEPGVGKSLLALHLAARITLRSPLPPHPLAPNPHPEDSKPKKPDIAVIASREDSSDTITNRLLLANCDPAAPDSHDETTDAETPSGLGADTRLIFFLNDINTFDPSARARPAIRSMIEHLESRAKSARIAFLLFDPLPAFLHLRDISHGPTIRGILAPLLTFAQQHNTILVGIAHLNKSARTNQNPLHRILGSSAYAQLARSVLQVTLDTQSQIPNRRLVIPLKNNLSAVDCAYAFSIHSQSITLPDSVVHAPSIRWLPDPVEHPFLPRPAPPDPVPDAFSPSQIQLACDFLSTSLNKGPVPSSQLLKQARAIGLSNGTLVEHRS